MKTYSVLLMPDAITDLEGIYEYIAEQSGFPERAWAYVEKLRGRCHQLEVSPQRGQQRDDLLEGLRVCPLDKSTVAAFIVDDKEQTVCILNVFYGSRDYEALIGSPKSNLEG